MKYDKKKADALFEGWMEHQPSAKALARVNAVQSEATKQAIREKAVARWANADTKELMSERMRQANANDAVKSKRRAAQRRVYTETKREEHSARLKQALAGDEVRQRMREGALASNARRVATLKRNVPDLASRIKRGMNDPNVRDKMRKPRAEQVCPYCGHVGRGGIMKRWHFDNCKHKR